MKLTVTEIAVHKEKESPVFGDMVTRVKLADEGGGTFIEIMQDNSNHMNTIRLDFDEIEYVVKAIEMLRAGYDA